MKIECAHDAIVSLSKLKPHPGNPNKHPEEQIRLLAKIIGLQGWRLPVVVSKRSGYIVAGHARLLAAKALKLKEAPVDYQDFASEAEEIAHLIADNRIAELAEMDRAALRELAEQIDSGVFDMELTGFDPVALEELMTAAAPLSDVDAEPQINKADELRRKWQVKRGQIWELGAHLLMCGDSTNQEEVERVMCGDEAALVFTDPPYNVDYQGNESIQSLKARNRRTDGLVVSNDAMTDEQFDAFLDSFLKCLPLRIGGGYYVCAPAGRTETQFRYAFDRASGLTIRQCIVWVKDAFVFGRQDYHWRHESILYGWMEGAAHYFVNDHTQDTVWEIDRPSASEEHPTTKPTPLAVKAIANSSKPGETVWDGFMGSGTTIIACEQLGRKCRGMEIDPGYVAVAIQRWADATGKAPRLLNGR
jgi:DNA modification methylase